jgi:hypothetical protein
MSSILYLAIVNRFINQTIVGDMIGSMKATTLETGLQVIDMQDAIDRGGVGAGHILSPVFLL